MRKRITSLILTLSILIVFMPTMAAQASASINIGDYVQMGTYYGEPILWRCVSFEKISGYDDNGNPIIDSTDTVTEYKDGYLPLMLSDKIICLKPFDAAGETNTGTNSHGTGCRSQYGSNYWADSNIRSWLNSDASAGKVTWLCGNPPDKSHIYYNYYADEAGFLTNFSQSDLNAVKEAAQKSILAYPDYSRGIYTMGTEEHNYSDSISSIMQNYDNAYAEIVTDKMFLLDVKQVYEVYNNSDVLGDNYYIGEPTAQCITNSQFKDYGGNLKVGQKWRYWLRSPAASHYELVRCVSLGSIDTNGATYGSVGVRPAFYPDTDSIRFTSGSGTESSPYIIGGTVTSDWAKTEIEKAEEYDLIPDALVGEDLTQTINRAEFAAVSVKTYEALADTELLPAVSNPFSDTADLDVLKAYNAGIAIGISETEFEPNAQLNREQAATMLTRVFKRATIPSWSISTDGEFTLDYTKPTAFSDDKNISDWAKDSVYFMTANGIINGMGNNTFAPKNITSEEEAVGYANATREQALAIAVRMVENFK